MWLEVINLRAEVYSDKGLKLSIYGGLGEIRTHGRLPYTTFPRLHHRPLGHETKFKTRLYKNFFVSLLKYL